MMQKAQCTFFCFAMVALTLIVADTDSSEATAHSWESRVPSSFIERVILNAYDKEFIYYGFDARTPLIFDVEGPTQVRVLTRLRYVSGMEGEQAYEVAVFEDGVERKRTLHRTRTSKKASYVGFSDGGVGKAMRTDVAVDDTGRHTFEVRLTKGSGERVEARIFTLKEKVEITPVDYSESMTAFLSESRERTYYLLTPEHPVTVRVQGPTRLDLDARLDYEPGMGGKQMYVLKVLQDGEMLKSFHVESVRSSTVTYEERPTIIPGAAKTIEIDVPEGRHIYEFHLPNEQFNGVALRFRIPAADVW